MASAAKLRERRWVEKREDSGMTNDKFPMRKEIRIPKLKTIDRHPKPRVWISPGFLRISSCDNWIFAAACQMTLLPVSASAKTPVMDLPKDRKADIHSEEFLRSLMRKQLRLSVTCAATFLVALLGLPLLNYFFPELMATRVFGFTLTWFLLGVLFFPLVWLISWFFIRRSIALEAAEVDELAEAKR